MFLCSVLDQDKSHICGFCLGSNTARMQPKIPALRMCVCIFAVVLDDAMTGGLFLELSQAFVTSDF